MSADNVSHIEEKGSLRFVLESGFTAKTVYVVKITKKSPKPWTSRGKIR